MDTVGARASLRIDLNDKWTVTPQVMYQKQEGRGSWGEDRSALFQATKRLLTFRTNLPMMNGRSWA